MTLRTKEFPVRAEVPETLEADLELINRRFALRPLAAEEVYVRRLALCNDQYDRTGERFPRYYLERFAETLPGKPLLAHHDRSQFPIGRFFHAEVAARQEGARSVHWLHCRVYLIRTPANEELRAQIDAGVYSHVSIGFRWADLLCDLCSRSYFSGECPHVIDRVYDGRRCTATYAGDPARVEAVEGSLVYLGAQYGAVITKEQGGEAAGRCKLCGGATAEGERAELLAREGRRYREELRREALRLAGCVGAEQEAAALLEALGDPPAERLAEIVAGYRTRFDARFAPPPARLPEDRPRRPLFGLRRPGSPGELLP